MTGRHHGRTGDEGFTLVELLVTLGVLSCIATVLLGAVFSVRHVGRQLIAVGTSQEEVAAAQSILRTRIEALRAVPRSDTTTPTVDVSGDDQQLSFYAPPTGNDPPSGLQAFRLLRTATGDLVLFSAPSLSESLDLRSRSLVGWNRATLLQGVENLSISYFGPAPRTSGPHWQRFWGDRPQAPQLVRIVVRFAEADRRSWPDLIVRPAVTMNVACRFDTVSSRCSEVAGR